MAPAQSKVASDDGYKIPRKTPPLPLIPVTRVEEESCSYKLLSNPTKKDSAKYSFTMAVLEGTEDVRAAIQFYSDIHRVYRGLNMGNDPGNDQLLRAQLTERMLRGSALASFQKSFGDATAVGLAESQMLAVGSEAAQGASETDEDYQLRLDAAKTHATYDPKPADLTMALCQIIMEMAPHKALQIQKRWMRRHLRKTREMKVRTFATHLARINDEELPLLPPRFDSAQKLSEDEMIDILVNACPKKWSSDMDRFDFDPLVEGWAKTVDFLSRQEQAAEHEGSNDVHVVETKSKKPKTESSKGKGGTKTTGLKHCHYHGWNPTHDSNNCRTLKALGDKEQKKEGSSKPGQFKNKTWKRQADSGKDKAKKDLAAFVRKTIRAELNAFSKKRKSDDVEEGEIDAFDLSGFNYKDMDNLKIESDDDSVSC